MSEKIRERLNEAMDVAIECLVDLIEDDEVEPSLRIDAAKTIIKACVMLDCIDEECDDKEEWERTDEGD